jgi:hypothetical protein
MRKYTSSTGGDEMPSNIRHATSRTPETSGLTVSHIEDFAVDAFVYRDGCIG